jgi:hypothetical protein
MKLVCISNVLDGEVMDLVVGQTYEAIEDPRYTYDKVYHLKSEEPNVSVFYNVILFKRLNDMRNDKLKEIGL